MALPAPPDAVDLEVGDPLPSQLEEFRALAAAIRTALGAGLPEQITAEAVADLTALIATGRLRAVNGLTTLSGTVDAAADWVPIYDTSAAALRKVAPVGIAGVLGYARTVDPGTLNPATGATIDVVPATINRAVFLRLLEGGTFSKIGLHVIATGGGNISIAGYTNSGVGRAATPGARVFTTGTIACPSVGYAEVSLGATFTLAAGDWLAVSVDSTTTKFRGTGGAAAATDVPKGRAGFADTAHPLADPAPALTASLGHTVALIGVP